MQYYKTRDLKRYLLIFFLVLPACTVFAQNKDSVRIAASEKYKNPSLLKKIFLGTNYRSEWETPVMMPVFDIKKERGGFTIIKLGGGRQTKSLTLQDRRGFEWALRTVEKDPTEAIPKQYRKTFIKNIIQDLISASHPYAALTIPELSRAAGVIPGSQQLFVVPDDPALGEYRSIFANKVCLLEQRSLPASKNPLMDTEEFIVKIIDENDHLLNQEVLLRARLLDMLIADWDRHAGQIKWVMDDSTGRGMYYPMPRDHDQAFFYSNGLFVTVMSRVIMQYTQGFKKRTSNIVLLNAKSWELDTDLLNQLDRSKWAQIVKEFHDNVSDSVIARAVKKLPPEIYAIRGEKIAGILRARRDNMVKDVMKYYSFLATEVTIRGTDEAEFFLVKPMNKKLSVSVYSGDSGEKGRLIYHRIFDPDETKTIHLADLDKKDILKTEGRIKKFRLILEKSGGNDSLSVATKK